MTVLADRIEKHISVHQWKRGAYKGDAPIDIRRRENWSRVTKDGRIVFGNKVLMEVDKAQDTVTLRLSPGSLQYPSYKKHLAYAFNMLGMRVYAGTARKWGTTHSVLSTGSHALVRYYDAMQLDARGEPITPLLEFERMVADRERRAQFKKAIVDSGFMPMFPILYASAESPQKWFPFTSSEELVKVLSNSDRAEEWPSVICRVKYSVGYVMNPVTRVYERNFVYPIEHVKKTLLNAAVSSMTKRVSSGVTNLRSVA